MKIKRNRSNLYKNTYFYRKFHSNQFLNYHIIIIIEYIFKMGKKGVLLDNGKTAQSSMALYWKKGQTKNRKDPKEVKVRQQTQQDVDKQTVSKFQKWKMHKQKMITKAYTQKQQKIKQKPINHKQQQSQTNQFNLFKEKKQVRIPGFGNKQQLQKKLQIQKVNEADQSKNILILPPQYEGLTNDDIMNLLRSKKQKQQIVKIKKPIQQQKDIILGQQLYQRRQQPKKQQPVQQKKQQIIEQVQQLLYFKSDILNSITKGQKLEEMIKRNNTIQQAIQQQKQQQQQQPQIKQINPIHSGFIPKALRK